MKIKQNDIAAFNLLKEGRYALLNPLTRKMHTINETGRVIWDACKEAIDVEEVTSLVAERFHIPVETARKDVDQFVNRMLEFGLLERV